VLIKIYAYVAKRRLKLKAIFTPGRNQEKVALSSYNVSRDKLMVIRFVQ
jgi:hypothetical protein